MSKSSLGIKFKPQHNLAMKVLGPLREERDYVLKLSQDWVNTVRQDRSFTCYWSKGFPHGDMIGSGEERWTVPSFFLICGLLCEMTSHPPACHEQRRERPEQRRKASRSKWDWNRIAKYKDSLRVMWGLAPGKLGLQMSHLIPRYPRILVPWGLPGQLKGKRGGDGKYHSCLLSTYWLHDRQWTRI